MDSHPFFIFIRFLVYRMECTHIVDNSSVHLGMTRFVCASNYNHTDLQSNFGFILSFCTLWIQRISDTKLL